MKVIYHLANAIFIGLYKAAKDNNLYFKAQTFSIVRDLQEAFGQIVSIIPYCGSYGMYHVEQASFYKSAYECFYVEESYTGKSTEGDEKKEIDDDYDSKPDHVSDSNPKADFDPEEFDKKMKTISSETKKRAKEQFDKIINDQIINYENNLKSNTSDELKIKINESIISTIKNAVKLQLDLGVLEKIDIRDSLEDCYLRYYEEGKEYEFLIDIKHEFSLWMYLFDNSGSELII